MRLKPVFKLLKKALGDKGTKAIRPIGHGAKALLAAAYNGFPAKKLKVIGITGTKGKTSTTVYLGRLLNYAGIKTAYLSTAILNNSGDMADEKINPYKMTSIDAVNLQKELKTAVSNGCEYLIIELSSEGLVQNRHLGLGKLTGAIFLNIYPEHLDSHGSFDRYKQAKGRMFTLLKKDGFFIGNGDKEQLEFSKYMRLQAKDNESRSLYITRAGNYKVVASQKNIFKNIEIDNHILKTGCIADFEIANMAFALKALEKINKRKYTQVLEAGNIEFLAGVPGRMQWVVWENHIV
jgi:UDP-N-acetylmuramyl tripeptide synthase